MPCFPDAREDETGSKDVTDRELPRGDHPWIEQNPRGMLVVAILRRIVYTLLALFRGVTQRSDERRGVPWKRLLEEVYLALLRVTDELLRSLRFRSLPLLS